MSNPEPIDVPSEVEPTSQAMVLHQPQAVGAALPSEQIKPPVTVAQAKVEAVANLTFKAYERASLLTLTPEESAALQANFPDDAFRTGAAGKEDLIYIEHAHLRDRLNQVFGLGQWSIIPRNRWAEDYEYWDKYDKCNKKASRVYVEAMLVVRGAFVAEAIGDMTYYPGNAATNYGDAVEGAKTAALRRCAKELGVGLQAWKKEFCDAWNVRQRPGNRSPANAPRTPAQTEPSPPPEKTPHQNSYPAAAPTTKPPAAAKPAVATEKTRSWLLGLLSAGPGGTNRKLVKDFLVQAGILLPIEEPEDMPLRWVPTSKADAAKLSEAIDTFAATGEAKMPYGPHGSPAPAKKPEKPIEVPRDPAPADNSDVDSDDAPWRAFPMPWGQHAVIPLAELDKKYLYGLWANYTVESEYNGRPKKPETIAKDQAFRAALDQAGEHYKFEKKD